jgi:hypothetical protein
MENSAFLPRLKLPRAPHPIRYARPLRALSYFPQGVGRTWKNLLFVLCSTGNSAYGQGHKRKVRHGWRMRAIKLVRGRCSHYVRPVFPCKINDLG